jgi:hypothetical protein
MDATMRTSNALAITSTDLSRSVAVAPEQTVDTSVVGPSVTSAQARDSARLAARELVAAIRSLRAETRVVLPSVVALAPEAAQAVSDDGTTPDASVSDVHPRVDKAGLLAALGLAAGAVHSSRGSTSVVLTAKGVETVTNAGSVSVRVSAAIDKLNAALAQVAQLRSMSPETNQQVEAAIRAALALIASAGVQGITASSSGDGLQIDVSTNKLTESLAKIAQQSAEPAASDVEDASESVGTIVSRALTQFATGQSSSRRVTSADQSYASSRQAARVYTALESSLTAVDHTEYRPDE